jgi:hypothetical protein
LKFIVVASLQALYVQTIPFEFGVERRVHEVATS